MSADFTERSFSTPQARLKRFRAGVLRELERAGVAPDAELRVLEIGCGAGQLCLSLAEALPRASILGLDISAPNIRAAQQLAAKHPAGQRLRFQEADYMAAAGLPGLPDMAQGFDLILADSVFHLIGAPARPIFTKVAGELRPGGLLVMTLPGAFAYNALLWSVRRVCRLLRCRALDSAILLAARLLHGSAYSAEELRERLPYMFILPAFQDGPELRALVASLGLRLRHTEPLPHDSLAQPKHSLLACAKETP